MRLWSVHPKYLDGKGLVALWREGLLAQKVIAGKTKGYKHHPQLVRFFATKNPLSTIGSYLTEVLNEAEKRNYKFDETKILKRKKMRLRVNAGQLKYEFKHLLRKLKKRDPSRFAEIKKQKKISAHPIFRIKSGGIEPWEKV